MESDTANRVDSAATLKSTTKLAPITTAKTTATITTSAINDSRFPISASSSASTSPISPTASSPTTSHTSIQQPVSPILMDSVDSLTSCDAGAEQVFKEQEETTEVDLLSSTTSIAPGESTVAAVLHKKDSGTSMASAVANHNDSSNNDTSSNHHHNNNNNNNNSNSADASGVTASGARQPPQQDPSITPAGRVLTRPLSTSKLSSTPMAAPHILPNQRHTAGFNLATLGQLSPTAAAASGTMTMSRADTLAFLNSNSNNSYFTVGGSSSRASHHSNDINGIFAAAGANGAQNADGIVLPSGNRTMCGSDAISLLDLEDSHNDIVMIDSNGNSSASGVAGTAVVGETIASASAFVTNRHSSVGQSGVPSSVLSVGGPMNANGINAAGSSTSSSSNPAPRSSLPSLTSQAKRDAMQRAAMIAAMQQNGGAKILAAHRVGRRQDRPSRNIRFGEFHRICEIEYGFEQGKPLIANGRTLVHATRVLRIDDQEKLEEMLYLFSDVLVTGTKIQKRSSSAPDSSAQDTQAVSDVQNSSLQNSEGSSEEGGSKEVVASSAEQQNKVTEMSGSEQDLESIKTDILNNPYAGHLENQHISRLTQIQADIVEDDERPLLKVTAPQGSSTLLFDSKTTRDNFLSLLNDTIVAHKHHLLFQSKYLADLKKFKRHSAFSFDTSFLKTWGIPGGLNLGSIKPTGGSSSNGIYGGTIGPGGTLTSSPLVSPGGGAFDPYQYQQYLNRPQSMAGSLFSFALNGGAFPSFSDHSKDNSYATLRGTNAANALQYHHQQQQMLHNRLSMASSGSGRPTMDRTSSGSAFDALWFMKGTVGGDNGRSRRSAVDAITAPISGEDNREKHASDEFVENGSAASSVHSSSSAANLTSPAASTGSTSNDSQSTVKQTLSTTAFSLLPSSLPGHNNSNPIGTLRNGAGWVRDEDAAVCMVCSNTKFGVLVRKHHCRLCGRVICWKCCQMKDVIIPAGTPSSSIPHELHKPIRVCLDCIEQDTSEENNLPRQQQQQSPVSSSFPLHGVFGKLMSSTSTSPQLVTSATNATGSTFTMPQTQQAHTQIPFYPRMVSYGRNGNPYPHHHRASMYRIDVECVGEEDEEEDEEESEDNAHQGEKTEASDSVTNATASGTEPSLPEQHLQEQLQSSNNTVPKSNHGTLRLKDLDPADINEEEVNHQIMTLESEVESLLIQNAPLMFGGAIEGSGHTRGSSGAAVKTRVLRGIPREFMQGVAGLPDEDEVEEDHEDEEKTMEELLAEQDEQMKRILTR
ncbi:Zinc finger FYVE domain-containing protein 26 [Mortierella sp. AD094]|nr:Zinc finger FYVE domain-containing protein 26 [Mortierella sp. AD094]